MGSMEEGEKEILGSLPKPKLFTVNPVKNSDLNIPSSNSTTPRKKGQGVAGIGEVKNWSSIGEGLIGNGARAAAYLTTHFTNKRVLDHALDAIRSKYLGAMKSMPIQQPLQRYNITPMTSLFDKQRTEFRNASRQIAKNFADSKLQVAQFLATEDQIAKREDNLLNQISKHITEVDLANTQSRNMHAKDEQAIADYNRNLGGQQKAEESMALAQYAQKQGDNFNKSNAEFRTDWNKYLASKDQINLYENYQDVFNKYRAETDPSKKAEYAEQIGLLSYLIKHGGSTRNPITYGRS